VLASIVVTVTLAFEVPPVLPIPDGLEICILQAELCAAQAAPVCQEPNTEAMGWCISTYETCSYDYPEAHTSNCRQSHVWCALEVPLLMPGELPEYVEECVVVNKFCPSLTP
jgi:hypothetical protein